MNIGDLCFVLDRLAEIYGSAGAKVPASDLKIFRDVLRPHSNIPVAQFVKIALSGLTPPSARGKARKKASAITKTEPLNEEAVRYHVAQLRTAGVDKVAFDRAVGN